jgi:glycosyltransferase involved in cell wall biosynthesis
VRIAVNTRLLLKGKLEGIGWFTYETLNRITRAHPEHEFIFLFDRPYNREFLFSPNVSARWLPPPTRHISLFTPWFEFAVPWMLKQSKADVFVSPDGHLSLRSKLPSVAVIHDLNFHHLPETLPLPIRNYYNTFFPRFARKATRIATVSEYTKRDIVASYGFSADKIDVTWNGSNMAYHPLTAPEVEQVRGRITRGRPYFLFIGLIIPRKNLGRLMQAYDAFRQKTGIEIDLVVVGEKKWWDEEHEAVFRAMRFGADVHFLGRLEPNMLAQVLGAALALTYVPVFEGFGIPILEGFSAGIPVITSNVTSMPEVAGEAAVYANPYDVNSIAEALEKVAVSEPLRSAMVTSGLERRKQFSWDITANRLWDCIARAMA